MTMLIHREPASDALPFALAAVKAHVRVTHDYENDALTTIAATAALEIEQFAQIALLFQTVRVTIFDAQEGAGLTLPIGPVVGDAVPTVTIDGDAFDGFDFYPGNRPYIRWNTSPAWGKIGRIGIVYLAGFGATETDIPADLAQALMDQAALLYDARSPMDERIRTTSPHMARVGARYRGVRS